MQKRTVIALGVGLMGAVLAAGSAVAQTQAGEAKEVISNGGLIHTLTAAPVMGEPYSAVQEQRMVQTLADGSKVNRGSSHHAVLRDSQGRVRVEQPMVCQCKDTKTTVVTVYVLDPVAHTMTVWSTGGAKVATIFKLPEDMPKPAETVSLTSASGANSRRPQPIITTENLPVEVLQGVAVDVVKTTTIVPAGRSGNDADITKTHEVWTSQEMKLVLKEEWSDPRTGLRTVDLANFVRGEPDAALFRPPADFTVKDLKQTLAELQQRLSEMEAKM